MFSADISADGASFSAGSSRRAEKNSRRIRGEQSIITRRRPRGLHRDGPRQNIRERPIRKPQTEIVQVDKQKPPAFRREILHSRCPAALAAPGNQQKRLRPRSRRADESGDLRGKLIVLPGFLHTGNGYSGRRDSDRVSRGCGSSICFRRGYIAGRS